MQYEQDYIMRLIRQVIRALVYVLLDKKMGEHYEMPANRIVKSGDDLLYRLLSLADAGQICEAENRLYAQRWRRIQTRRKEKGHSGFKRKPQPLKKKGMKPVSIPLI